MSDVTRILQSIEAGDTAAAGELLPLVYEELRRMAAGKMARESPGQTLQPTALVHEAWLRLSGDPAQKWKGRAHFFGAAAEAMRRILIDNARRKRAARHGGGQERVNAAEIELAAVESKDDEMLAVDEALDRLAREEGRAAEVVKLRYFAGLTIEETAEALSISVRTANRHWAYARAWLYRHLNGPPSTTPA